jgi:hypothetical protein
VCNRSVREIFWKTISPLRKILHHYTCAHTFFFLLLLVMRHRFFFFLLCNICNGIFLKYRYVSQITTWLILSWDFSSLYIPYLWRKFELKSFLAPEEIPFVK